MIWICKLYKGQGPLPLLILEPHLTGSISHWTESGCCEIQIRIPFWSPASTNPSGIQCVNKPVGAQLAFSSGSSHKVQISPLFLLTIWSMWTVTIRRLVYSKFLKSWSVTDCVLWQAAWKLIAWLSTSVTVPQILQFVFPASHHVPYGSHGYVVDAQRRPDWLWIVSQSSPLRGPPAFFHSSSAQRVC